MPDTDIDTLKIKATVDTKEAEDGLTRLKNSLNSLKKAFTSKNTADTSVLDSITDAAKKLDEGVNGKLKGLADGLTALKSAGKVPISKDLPGYIADLGVAVSSLKNVDMTKLTEMADGLGALKSVRSVKMPKAQTAKGNGKKGTSSAQETKNVADDFNNAQESAEKTARETSESVSESWESASKRVKDALRDIATQFGSSFKTGFYKGGPNGTPWSDMSWMDRLKNGAETMGESMAKGASLGESAMAGLAALGPEVMVAITAVKTLGKAISTVWGITKTVTTATVKAVTKIELGIAKIGAALLALPIKAITNTVGKLVTKLQKGVAALTRVAIYRLIRSVLKEITQGFGEGIKNLYQYSNLLGGTFAKSMDKIATSALYLKNSLGAMAAPLINALAPAIDFLVDKFVDLLNVINQVLAALTGATTWTKAIKYPYTYAEAANIATKANKELKKSILSIDEINKLTDNTDKNKGGSGSNLDYSSMFQEQKIDSPIAKFFANLKKAFEDGDYEGVGKILGNGVNDAVQKLNDYISWDSVGDKISSKITSVATIFNSFGETVKWDEVGTMFSNGINTILNSVNLALNEFDLVDAGTHFSEVLNGFVYNLEWDTLGDTIHDFFMVSLGMIDAAITEFDWKALGANIAEMFKNINTTEVLTNLTDTVFDLFDGALEGVDAFIEGGGLNTDFASIIDHVGDKLAERDWSSIGKKLAKAFKKLKVPDTLKALTNLFFDVVSAGVQTIGGFLDTADGKQQLTEVVDNLFENIKGFLTNDLPVIKSILNSAFKTIGGALVNLLGDMIKEKIEEKGAVNLLIDAFKYVTTVTSAMANPVGTVMEKIVKSALQWLIDKLTGGAFSDTMTNVWNSIITALANVVTTVTGSEKLGNAVLKLLKPVEDKASTVGENAANNLTDSFSSNIDTSKNENKLKTAMNNLVGIGILPVKSKGTEAAQNLVDGVKNNLDTDLNKTSIKEKIKGLFGSVDVTKTGENIGKQLGDGICKGIKNTKLPALQVSSANGQTIDKSTVRWVEPSAKGGLFDTGEFFLAREAGPELIGTIGNRSAVVNNEQIVDSVSQGVYEANSEQTALLREQNNILRAILGKDESGNEYTAEAILNTLGMWNRRAGMAVSPAG